MDRAFGAYALLNSVKRHLRDTAKKLLPTRLQRRFPYSLFGRKIGDYPENRAKERLFGSFAPLVPRVEDMFDGPRSLKLFKEDGEQFLRIYHEICGLQPSEKMLDVGCGIGRKTIPLTHYLTSEATYQGIDVNKTGIEWCQEKINSKFANFRFQRIDVYNKFYNPQGKLLPALYKFPFESETFDFVMLGSVFTHVLPTDGVNYLSEVHRVLRRGGGV
jgi:SAM-dependent methyltransferase